MFTPLVRHIQLRFLVINVSISTNVKAHRIKWAHHRCAMDQDFVKLIHLLAVAILKALFVSYDRSEFSIIQM